MSGFTSYANLYFTSTPIVISEGNTREQAVAKAIKDEAKRLFDLKDDDFDPRHIPSSGDKGYEIKVTEDAAKQARRVNPEHVVRSKRDW